MINLSYLLDCDGKHVELHHIYNISEEVNDEISTHISEVVIECVTVEDEEIYIDKAKYFILISEKSKLIKPEHQMFFHVEVAVQFTHIHICPACFIKALVGAAQVPIDYSKIKNMTEANNIAIKKLKLNSHIANNIDLLDKKKEYLDSIKSIILYPEL